MKHTKTARAIIETLYQNEICIVTIKRQKFKDGKIIKEYYTLPGGHNEENESFEEAVIREVFEELNVNVSIKEKLLSMYNEDLDRYEEFFLCTLQNKDDIITKGTGPEWTNPDIERYGSYEIVYINVKNIKDYNILPPQVKKILIERYGL